MNRRGMFKFLAAAPLAIPMAAMAKANEPDPVTPNQEDAPTVLTNSLSLYYHKMTEPKKVPAWEDMPAGQYFSGSSISLGSMVQRTDIQATISVGADGNLWIKPYNSDKWKRVVTE